MNVQQLSIRRDRSILDGIAVIDSHRYGIVLITDEQDRLAGTVTDGDVRRAVLAGIDLKQPIQALLDRKAGTLYAKPITAAAGTDRPSCLKLLLKHGILHLPLVDRQGRVADLICRDEFIVGDELPVQAVLMAGGAGTRLRPLTLDTPKPMLPLGDRPLMEIVIKQLRHAGIKNVNITTHHLDHKITEHFQDGTDFGVTLSYLHEDQPMGTAGSLGKLKTTDSTLLVMNGDILTDLDFKAMIAYHREHEADLTVAVRQYDVQVPFGVVECKGYTVQKITEKPLFNFFVNAGIYLVEPKALAYISDDGEHLDMTDLIQRLLTNGRQVVSFPILEQWIDIGQHTDYKQAQEIVKNWSERS